MIVNRGNLRLFFELYMKSRLCFQSVFTRRDLVKLYNAGMNDEDAMDLFRLIEETLCVNGYADRSEYRFSYASDFRGYVFYLDPVDAKSWDKAMDAIYSPSDEGII